MNSFVRMSSIAFVALTAGCASTDISQPPGGPAVPMVRLRAEPYAFTFHSGFNRMDRIVVRDANAWQAIWSQIYSYQSPQPPLPAVDFATEMIVVAAFGTRGSSGYNILLTQASEFATNGTIVTVDSYAPGPTCIVATVLTQPADIARLPLRSGAVSFVERTHVSNC